MPATSSIVKHRVTYQVASGKRQTRRVEVAGGSTLDKDAAEVRKILAEEHKVRPDQIKLYQPGHEPPPKPKGPSVADINAMSKADLLDLCGKDERLKAINTDQQVGPLRESIIMALGAK